MRATPILATWPTPILLDNYYQAARAASQAEAKRAARAKKKTALNAEAKRAER